MERLYAGLILILVGLSSYGQEKLCVFKVEGVVVQLNGPNEVKKGDILYSKDIIKLSSGAQILLTDKKGKYYQLEKEGTYSYTSILKLEDKSSTSLTINTLKVLYKYFIGKSDRRGQYAFVNRADEIPRIYPIKNTWVQRNALIFEWEENEEFSTYFFYLRNKSTGKVLKIGIDGAKIVLDANNRIFDSGYEFEWALSTKQYVAQQKNLRWDSFQIISLEYHNRKNEYRDLIADLKKLGYSDNEIDQVLCGLSLNLCSD